MSVFWVHGRKFYRTDDIQNIKCIIKSNVHVVRQDIRMVVIWFLRILRDYLIKSLYFG